MEATTENKLTTADFFKAEKKALQDNIFNIVESELISNPHLIGLSERNKRKLIYDSVKALVSDFYYLKYDYLRQQEREERSKMQEQEFQIRLKAIEAELNISVDDFGHEVLVRADALVKLRNPNRNYVLDEFCRKSFYLLLHYFAKTAETNLNRKKGIWLGGPVGAGKSTLFQAFAENPVGSFVTINAKEIVESYKNDSNFIHKLFQKKAVSPNKYGQQYLNLLIEEVGREPLSINVNSESFKNEPVNVMQLFFSELYEQQPDIIVHVSTNADTEEKWRNLYGESVESRIHELFNVIIMSPDAPDRRKQSNF